MIDKSDKELPKGWVKIELKHLMSKSNKTLDPSKFKDETFELYSIPSYETMKPEIIKGSKIGSSKKQVEENDVLLSRIVPHIQRCWVVNANVGFRKIASGEWIVFRSKNIYLHFLRYFLLSYGFHQRFMKTISGVGGSLTRANPNQTGEFEMPFPPLREQMRIVSKIEELFSELDKGVESLKLVREKLRVYRHAVLKSAFQGKFTNKDINEHQLPKGWDLQQLGEIGNWNGGGTPSKTNSSYWENGTIDWVTPKDMKSEIISSSEDRITLSAIESSSAKLIPAGSVLIVVRSGILRRTLPIALVEHTVTVNQDMQAITPSIAIPKYIFYCLKAFSEIIRTECSKDGTTVESIDSASLKRFKIPIAPFDEQQLIIHQIESRLSVCETIDKSIDLCLRKSVALRQSILKKAFEGKLVPQDPNDEHASVLLERIIAEAKANLPNSDLTRTKTRKPNLIYTK